MTYFSWWYGKGLRDFWQAVTIMTSKIYAFFSISILARTLFDPWKRDVVHAENLSFGDQFRLLIENLISRFVGFAIRLITILIGLFATAFFFILMMILVLSWLFLPLIVLFLIFNGVRTISNG